MPEQTALALEHILSLSSKKENTLRNALVLERSLSLWSSKTPNAKGSAPISKSSTNREQEMGDDRALVSSMFFEVVDPAATSAEGGSRPRFSSAMSWTHEYDGHLLVQQTTNEDLEQVHEHVHEPEHKHQHEHEDSDDEEHVHVRKHYQEHKQQHQGDNSHETDGAPRTGPWHAIRQTVGPSAPRNSHYHSSHSSPLSLQTEEWESEESHERNFGCFAAHGKDPHEVTPPHVESPLGYEMGEAEEAGAGHGPRRSAGQDSWAVRPLQHQSELSHFIPQWAYETLPRDCLIMLLQSALTHKNNDRAGSKPEDTDVAELCMRALAPLTEDEYHTCFGICFLCLHCADLHANHT